MRFRRLGFSVLVAGLLAPSISPSPALAGGSGTSGGLADTGTLILRTGDLTRFEYFASTPPPLPIPLPTPTATQSVSASTASGQKCWLTPTTGNLMVLGPNANNNSVPRPGFVGNSIGIYGGGNSATARGVACSRVAEDELLTLTLGPQLSGRLVSNTRLDIEVKSNARVVATARLGNTIVGTFELQTGAGIGATPFVAGSVVTTCSASSDSGPDSGPNDNCTWSFQATYDTLELKAIAGAFSLEGGGDWGSVSSQHYSEFTLLAAEGAIGCSPSNNDAFESSLSIESQVTRIDACTLAIPYVLAHRTTTATPTLTDLENFVDFFTDSTNPNQEYNVRILWNPIEVASISDVPGIYTYWWLPSNPSAQFPLELCQGSIVSGSDADGNPAFFVTGDSEGSPYACLLSQSVDELPNPTVNGLREVQVTQLIYLRGDPTFGGR